MQIKVASRMEEYEEGIFQLLNEQRIEKERRGEKVYNLSVGTPDFPPAQHIVDAVVEAAKKPENYKYSLGELPQLIQAVIDRYRVRYGVCLEENEIMSVYGSQEGLAHIGLSLCDSGDIVLVPNPGYPIFEIGSSLAGAVVVPYMLYPERNYEPSFEEIPKSILEKTRYMIVSYPLNPICKCAPQGFYERLITWARENEIIIIHDNAYSDITFDGRTGSSFLAYPGAKDVGVEYYSLSKSFNYTGARVSFLVGNAQVVQNFKKLRSQIDYGTFLPVQYGAVAALTGTDDQVVWQRNEYEKRRNALCRGLSRIGWKVEDSEGTMFAWAKIPEKFGSDDVEFVKRLLDATGVLCTPGSSFGSLGKGYVRFALTLPVEVIKEAVNVIDVSGILK